MKKKFLTCGVMAILAIIVFAVIAVVALNNFQKGFHESILNELGFKSQSEYDDYTQNMQAPFDETSFYQDIYSEHDKEFVKSSLQSNLKLIDNAPIILDSGYLNIEALDKENNSEILSPMEFNDNQFAYFLNYIYTSMFIENTATEFSALEVLKYSMLSTEKHQIVLKWNTTNFKKTITDFQDALTNTMYMTIDFDLIKNSRNKYEAINEKILFNKLSEEYNTKCCNLLTKILKQSPQNMFSDLIITLINSFELTTKSKTHFLSDKIIVGGE